MSKKADEFHLLLKKLNSSSKLNYQFVLRSMLHFISITNETYVVDDELTEIDEVRAFFVRCMEVFQLSSDSLFNCASWTPLEIENFLETGQVPTRNPYFTLGVSSLGSAPFSPKDAKWGVSATGRLNLLMNAILERAQYFLSNLENEVEEELPDMDGLPRILRNPIIDNHDEYIEIVSSFEALLGQLQFSNELSTCSIIDEVRRRHLIDLLKTLIISLEAPLLSTALVADTGSEIDKFVIDVAKEIKSDAVKDAAKLAKSGAMKVLKLMWEYAKLQAGGS